MMCGDQSVLADPACNMCPSGMQRIVSMYPFSSSPQELELEL